jgi:hypothetical protein
MNLGEYGFTLFKTLWWVPLPFLLGKVITKFSKAWGRIRNRL